MDIKEMLKDFVKDDISDDEGFKNAIGQIEAEIQTHIDKHKVYEDMINEKDNAIREANDARIKAEGERDEAHKVFLESGNKEDERSVKSIREDIR